MKNGLISVIVPMFNVEKHITRCVDSILKQSYSLFELFLINDGSTDATLEICKVFSSRDPRIHLINQQNRGVSAARNRGLSLAQGEYIVFIDADDVLPIDSFQIRIDNIGTADLLIASLTKIDKNDNIIWKMQRPSKSVWKQEEALCKLFINSEIGYQGYLVNKLFKNSIIQTYEIRFRENIAYNEDRLFMLYYLFHTEEINIIDQTVYFYIDNTNSAMNQVSNFSDTDYDRLMSEFYAFEEMKKALRNKKQIYDFCCYATWSRAKFNLGVVPKNANKIRKELEKIKFRNAIIVVSSRFFSLKKKLKCLKRTVL